MTRTVLSSNTTAYVNSNPTTAENCNGSTAQPGSLSNSGLSLSAPFLTLQQAVDYANLLDFAGFTLTVQLSDGTYTAGATCNYPFVGGGGSLSGNPPLIFQGNQTTPAATVVDLGTGGAPFICNSGAKIQCQYLQASGAYCFNANMNGSEIWCNNVITDWCDSDSITGYHYYANRGGYIDLSGPISILGTGQPYAVICGDHNGGCVRMEACAMYIAENVTVRQAFAYTLTMGEICVTGESYITIPSGISVTGPAWYADNAAIQWSGGNDNAQVGPGNVAGFPGSSAGVINGFGVFHE